MGEDGFATGFALGQDSNGNNNGGFGDGMNGILGLAALGLIFGDNGILGNGGNRNNGGAPWATQADVRAAVDQQTLISKLDQQTYGLADSTYALNNTITSGFHGVDNAICNLGYQMKDCCCETQRMIERGFCDTNYNLATQSNAIQGAICNSTRDIIDNQNANYRGLMDFMVQSKMDALRSENEALRLSASQARQNQYLIDQLRPCPVPAYITCNPYAASWGMGYNNSGCGNGCGCGGY